MRELAAVIGSKTANVEVLVRRGMQPESYRIVCDGKMARIVSSDETGAMYGLLEFAERAKLHPSNVWKTHVEAKPYLADRGVNLFLTLPWNYQKNDTDFAIDALTDPRRWWFQNEDYWQTLFDLMARSRLNWLDIHGAWDISVTNAPNLYAYFVTSPSFPLVGVPESVKTANLRRLNWVIEKAHSRGIRVSLMAYEANFRIPQNPNPPYEPTEHNLYQYTREVVEKLVRNAPKLDAIGFRIGESGKSETFFRCYGEAVKNSGRDIPLITRSWITTKQKVLPLARASNDFTVEIKYNGEHWGAPYIAAGGRVANWYSYSFEDYLSDSGAKGAATWPGNPAEGGGFWPSQPYKIVWQVRANGTHRIFPFYNPDFTRRTIAQMKIGTATGYTVEGLDAYFPKPPDYYLANSADRYCNWIHERDELYWMCWGRLGYDPHVPDAVFDSRAKDLLGRNSETDIRFWKAASTIVPLIFCVHSLGPDHRSNAPELEWDGDTDAFIQGQGFDSHLFMPLNEQLANRATQGVDGRIKYDEALDLMDSYPGLSFPNDSSIGRVKEIHASLEAVGNLLRYHIERMASAKAYAETEAVQGSPRRNAQVDRIQTAARCMELLASNPYYKPFTDRLRMHTNSFSWSQEAAKVKAEAARIEQLPTAPDPFASQPPVLSWQRAWSSWKAVGGNVVASITSPTAVKAWLLVKPLPSSTYFHKLPMRKIGNRFEAQFPRERFGHMIAFELMDDTRVWRHPRYPAPYKIIPALPGPTPQIYNASEAMTYLNPSAITPQKYAGLLLGTRAWAFFGGYDRAVKRKLLDPVERGMRLVILQQDFNRYRLDWLPNPLRFESGNWNLFDPAGALDLPKVETQDIMWQRFLPSRGWTVYGNGGIAKMNWGKGEIWVTSARLMQRMHIPTAARAFVRLLSLGGREKPTVLVDSCSEGADYSSSCHADLMNSHGIPFVTMGELIAHEQGMNSFAPIPGNPADDDVLNGKGSQIANAFLRNEVMKLAKRTPPKTLAEFEQERSRRKAELMRCLGLDPLPRRTPLNARITGVIQREGYTIQKLVFESRPKFFVTAFVYKSDSAPAGRLPVIVNVNGHWAHKKGEDRVQLRCAFQALHGYLAIAVDSPGWSFEGNSLIERRAEGDHNDFALVEGGTNATGFYVWDVMRALDYLSTRNDADMTRVGITGASGGGLATLYAFAADDRFKAAVPVVCMSSMELAPDNGCLCNHVPGTMQIGDRSDVIAIQAPKPVYIMGAQNDPEFPPDAMRLTVDKMKREWSLFDKDGNVFGKIFDGPHDYNQPMREAMIGFFDKALRNVGDGSPVPQPRISAFDPEDRSFLVLPEPIKDERTMRDLAVESLNAARAAADIERAISINGGKPQDSPLNYREKTFGTKRFITFESQPGLVTPGVLLLPEGKIDKVEIIVADEGKQSAASKDARQTHSARLYLDIVGTGELSEIELRYPIYLGRSLAFIGGWQIVRAAEAMRRYSSRIKLNGIGPLSSQAVMFAGLLKDEFSSIDGMDCLQEWGGVFRPGVPAAAVQPRANLLGRLSELRALVKRSKWQISQSEGTRTRAGS